MAYILSDLNHILNTTFDDIIDVRSPGEFLEDHLPGAISLPVLDDDERARVGTIYKQESAFAARRIGGALIARRSGSNIETHLLDKPGSYRPLVYCWRGGMRSNAFATILKQIGWRAETLDGGYKSYRRAVVNLLYNSSGDGLPQATRMVILDGNTGTAKTELLHRMASMGAQVLDLEGLAHHRGSLFGGLVGPQPSQKAFDTAIAMHLVKFDSRRPVFVEAESSRIGRLSLPASLWSQMRRAPRIRLEADLAERGAHLARAYGDIATDRARLARTIDLLRPYHPAERIATWKELADAGALEALAEELVAHHYDPKYARQRAREQPPELGRVRLMGFAAVHLDEAAAEIVRLAERLAPPVN